MKNESACVAAIERPLLRLATVASWLLSAFSVLTLLARHWWIADICANLRVQWVIGLIGTGFILALYRKWKLLLVSVPLMVLHVPWLASAIVVDKGRGINSTDSVENDLFIVTTANVYTWNSCYEDIERELLATNADVVAILELSDGLREHLTGDFAEVYPWSLFDAQDDGNFGIGLYSRHQWDAAQLICFGDERLPSINALLKYQGRKLNIIATHTYPPIGARHFEHRNQHLKNIAATVASFKNTNPNSSVIVMGDLNITPWSPIFQEFIETAGLARTGAGRGFTPTWYRFPAFPFGLMLDHILTTTDLDCVSRTVGPDIGSDHRCVTASLRVQ